MPKTKGKAKKTVPLSAQPFNKAGFYKIMCKKLGVDPTVANPYIDTNGVLTTLGKKQYKRCTFRKGKRDAVFNKAKAKSANGKAYDPNKPSVQLKRKKFAMGHKPGYEHEKHQIVSAIKQKPRKTFNNEYNDTKKYQAEDPLLNSSHKYENPTMEYFGN